FASEAKAILAGSGPAGLDTAALQDFLALGYSPAPSSMFEGIRKLPPASLLIGEDGRVELRRYWTPAMAIDDGRSERDWEQDFVDTMRRAVTSQMVSDVPLGAFLSGGIDSSAIVAFMAEASSRPVKTYSIGFEGGGPDGYYNELPWARRVAKILAT